MYLVSLTPKLWEQYCSIYERRMGEPMRLSSPPAGVWLTDKPLHLQPNLMAGVCLYRTDGPFIMAEALVLNDAFGLKVRRQAAMSVIQAVLAIASTEGLMVIAAPSQKGLAKLLLRNGFSAPQVALLRASPGRGMKLA